MTIKLVNPCGMKEVWKPIIALFQMALFWKLKKGCFMFFFVLKMKHAFEKLRKKIVWIMFELLSKIKGRCLKHKLKEILIF